MPGMPGRRATVAPRPVSPGQTATGPARGVAAVLQLGRPDQPDARGVRHRQPQQHVDLRGRSARPGGLRVRHQPGRRPADRPHEPERVARLAARARRQHRRPRHRQPQRSRRRHEADHARRERLLPARLHVDGGADRREVPHHRRAGEAPRRRRARAQGLLRLHRGGRGARDARRRRPGRRRKSRTPSTPSPSRRSSGHAARFWTGTTRRPADSRASRSCGSRSSGGEGARATDVPARVMLTATARRRPARVPRPGRRPCRRGRADRAPAAHAGARRRRERVVPRGARARSICASSSRTRAAR